MPATWPRSIGPAGKRCTPTSQHAGCNEPKECASGEIRKLTCASWKLNMPPPSEFCCSGRFPARCRAILFSQDLVYALPLAVLAPFIEIIVYLLPGRKVVWHHPPGNATTEQIEASIDDATQGGRMAF